MSTTANSILGLGRSLAGKTWQWRGGNMDLATGATSLDHDLVTQLLLARGIPPHDVERHRTPSLRAFLPDPSEFRDMDTAAERLAQAVLTGERLTIYGDYDVDGATSAALLMLTVAVISGLALIYVVHTLWSGVPPEEASGT